MSDEQRPAPELEFFKAKGFDNIEPTLDFVPGMLHDSTVAVIYGPSGSGKTFFALHLLCSTALGRTVFGNPTEKRNGLYVGLEGEANIKVRIKAWLIQNQVDVNPIDYALGAFDLGDDRCVNALIEYMLKREIDFVVIDTLAMAMVGLDEISGQHVSVVLEALHRIKRETRACVVVLDHTGKNVKAGARGHSSKLGNVDTSIEIVVHNVRHVLDGKKRIAVDDPITAATPRSLIVHKQRDAEGGGGVRFRFALTRHATDVLDARGKPIGSLAVNEAEHFKELPAEEDALSLEGLTPSQREAAEILAGLNAKLGRAGPADEFDLKRALKRESWGPANPASWRSTYRNLRSKLRFDSHGGITSIG